MAHSSNGISLPVALAAAKGQVSEMEDRIALLAQQTPLPYSAIEWGWKAINREYVTTKERQDALWNAYVTVVLWCGRNGFSLQMIGAIDHVSGGMTHEGWIRFADRINQQGGDRLPPDGE